MATMQNKKSNKSVPTKERELSEASTKNSMIVYKKKCTYKGATENDFWYSGTRADGDSVILKFKCEIPTASSAFIVSNIVGNCKEESVDYKGVSYRNFTYYVSDCDFEEIEGEPLPL